MPTKFMKLGFNPLRSSQLKRVEVNGAQLGYDFEFHLNYYRGIHLSCIEAFDVWINDQPVRPELHLNGKIFTPEQLKDMYKEWWSPQIPMTIRIPAELSLIPGQHEVKIHFICRCASMKFGPGAYAAIDGSGSRVLELKEVV